MDSGSIQKVMEKQERSYIWLEKELKRCMLENVSMVVVLFLVLVMYIQFAQHTIQRGMLLLMLTLAFTIWISKTRYQRIYQSFEHIARYLEQYELGNYQFHCEEGSMEEGIGSQIIEQLDRMGTAFEILKNQMMEEKENTKGLITDISHQLKTPLSALKLGYELSEDDRITQEELQEIHQRGYKEVRKLEALLDALTNLSRMEVGMIQIEPEEGDIVQTLKSAVNSIYMKAYQKHIDIEVEEGIEQLEAKDRMILHDCKWTEEALVNLLDNAVKYSDSNTTIRIRLEPQISYIFLYITDEGTGIAKEEYGNVFKRFYRVKQEGSEAIEGSGVGLYLVRRIIESQGGSVSIQAGKIKGSVFQVLLPKQGYSLGK